MVKSLRKELLIKNKRTIIDMENLVNEKIAPYKGTGIAKDCIYIYRAAKIIGALEVQEKIMEGLESDL